MSVCHLVSNKIFVVKTRHGWKHVTVSCFNNRRVTNLLAIWSYYICTKFSCMYQYSITLLFPNLISFCIFSTLQLDRIMSSFIGTNVRMGAQLASQYWELSWPSCWSRRTPWLGRYCNPWWRRSRPERRGRWRPACALWSSSWPPPTIGPPPPATNSSRRRRRPLPPLPLPIYNTRELVMSYERSEWHRTIGVVREKAEIANLLGLIAWLVSVRSGRLEDAEGLCVVMPCGVSICRHVAASWQKRMRTQVLFS